MADSNLSARSAIRKRSVLISGHRTSISLEEAFWLKLKELGDGHGKSINQMVTEIDNDRLDNPNGNLSSAIRVYILEQLEAR
ncbi:MAG: ribbon-helix-helix domain-containing protein [Rhodospirillaceae bacterium]|jgi:predicted DNA-binding ribbon-helix-helix protein|nr:ribbon-helix-helix domain-containing protein [Rhodospirillaceae bacterium]MBT7955570.1 ribbon-helix-helix domain-containing protein [Rhodospirillaceae bacterium]